MKDENKTKVKLIKELKTLRKEREKGVFKDITKLKQIEQAIQESENRFRELFKHMSSGVAIYEAKDNGRDFIIKGFNRAAEKIDKVNKEDIIGKSVLKVFPGVKDFGLFKVFQEVYKTGKPQRHPISFYQDQRITGWRENYVYKLLSDEIVAVYDDITERKKAEEQTKDSEGRLKILFDYAPDAYYISDLKGNFIDGNKAAERVIGYKREELIGSSFLKLKLLSLADAAKAAKLLVKNLRGQPTGPDEFVLNRKDKSKVTVEISTYPVKIKGRTLALGIARDITERKQAEDKLLKNQYYLTKAQEIGIIGTWELDIQKNILIWTDENYKIFGVPLGTEMNHEIFLNCVHPDDKDYLHEKWSARLNNEPYDIEFRLIVNDKVKWVREKADIKFDTEGNPIRAIGFTQDITERKQAEEKTRQKTEDLTLVNVLNDAVNRGGSLLEILQLLARETKRIFSCYGATVYLLSEDREHLVMQTLTLPSAIISRVEKLIGIRIPAISIPIKTGSLYRKVLQDGKLQLINDPKTIQGLMAEFTENKILKKLIPKIYPILGTRSVINIPLVSKGEAIGLLDVSRKEPFTEFDLKRFETISGQLTSIIERKQAEQELSKERTLLKAIIDKIPVLLTRHDPNTNMLYLNKEFEKIVGWKTEEVKDIDLMEKVYPEPDYRKQAMEYMQKASTEWREFQVQSKSGKIIDSEWSNIRLDDGTQVGIGIDITERKQAEENIKNAKDELQIILDSVPALIFYKDTEGRLVQTNKANADAFGLPIKDIIGKTTEELFPEEQAKSLRKDDKEVIISGKAKKNIIESFSTPEGTRWAITDKMPYKDKEGKVIGVIGFAKDITVQRKAEQKLKTTYQRLKKTMDATIDTMSKIIEAKDPYTSNHQHRVCQLAVPLARELGLPEDKVEGIRIASLIHDIGKIGLPTEILSKPGKLSDIEFSLIKDHSQIGYDILKSIDFSYPIAQIVLQHHERLNGSGYPNNLKGDKIFLEAKIIRVADVVEAMSSFRPYRPALGIDKALEEISQNKGILYDPEVVDACLKLFKEKGFKFE